MTLRAHQKTLKYLLKNKYNIANTCMKKKVIKNFYAGIIITVYNIILELISHDDEIIKLITNTDILISLLKSIENPHTFIKCLLDNEINKESNLIFREDTLALKAITHFACSRQSHKPIKIRKENIINQTKMLINDFFNYASENINLKLILTITTDICSKYNKCVIATIVPFLINKILISSFKKVNLDIIKILQHVVTTIVSKRIFINSKSITVNITHISIHNMQATNGLIEYFSTVVDFGDISLDYYYSHKEDLEEIEDIIFTNVQHLLNSLQTFTLNWGNNVEKINLTTIVGNCKTLVNTVKTIDRSLLLSHLNKIVEIGDKYFT
jgi:hypothetical protein